MKRIADIIILLLATTIVKSQRVVERHLNCKDSSISSDIRIVVDKNDLTMDYLIKGHLSAGVFKAILYDPEGRQEGGFQLTADPKTDEPGGAKGQMSGPVKSPMPGSWRLHLEAQHCTGNLSYQIYFNKH